MDPRHGISHVLQPRQSFVEEFGERLEPEAAGFLRSRRKG
jgi:hypothetical protein